MNSPKVFGATLLAGAGALAMMAALTSAPAFAQSSEMSHLGIPVDRIGLVGFTVRDQLGEDPRATIEAVAACGIENIEFSGPDLEGDVPSFQGVDVNQISEFADEFGFSVPSLGVNAGDLQDRLDKVIEAAQAVGASYVRISGNRPQEGVAQTEDDYLALAEILNTAGGPLQEAGITVAYHNHGWEFEDLGDGRTGMDVLLAETDPESVAFELDLYWSETGGGDAIALIEDHPGRFPLLHVKDAMMVTNDAGEEAPTFATVGQGYIDFAAIFEHAETAGTEYFFIENDQPDPDGVTVACESYDYMVSAEAPN
ncbi:sugar phosphate isomerase/epimerase family protein [Pelagibacterium luteolum]|uniref:Sugar phosphate isomerase/epimerase n=1 Tax=Pelagibacterium luteolum TaxID=440168 RepID=A0A1G7SUJ1_9HYPH|nr:sugar phosphate isomerase/epimerase [Pelagibacterium luteolum]SDG26786.1 Sugar phosphate isomerase/epimerase [Pelagibacterium luteolum]